MSLPATIGRYEILGLLATGGMAEVLLAKLVGPAGFERAVVLKRVLPHLARQDTFRTMFLDEARVVAALRHPNIAQVHELGEEDDELFLVLEYVEGETLSSLARRLATRGERLPPHLAAHIAAETCAALHAAHELKDEHDAPRNVVHRDVSPQNVMVTYDGTVKVLDFGIAKAADRDTHTESGVMKGKFAYMSPEQCFDLELDRRSDLFSLGTVLWELSTGRRLFSRKSEIAMVRAICDAPLPSPRDVVEDYPAELVDVIAKALSRERDERYQTAVQMRRELVGVVRRLDPEGIPQEELAALMPKLFAERVEEKREMLRRVSSGSQLTHIPSAEASGPTAPPVVVAARIDRDARTVAAQEAPEPAPKPRRARWLLWAPLFLALGAALAVGWWTVRSEDVGPTDPPASEVTAAGVTAPTEAPDTTSSEAASGAVGTPSIELRVQTDPPGARVRLGERDLGVSPVRATVPRGDREVELTIEHDGFETLRETITADSDQRLRLSLTRSRRGGRRGGRSAATGSEASEGSEAGEEPSEGDPGYFRFD